MIAVLTGTTGLFGLVLGSFLNVVIYRVPAGLSVVAPRSACPGCHTPIRGRDNVPVLSWLLLGRRCRQCRMSISARYPAIETLTGLAFVAIGLWRIPAILTATGTAQAVAAALELVALLYLAAITIALAAIDLDQQKLPDAIVKPSYLVVAPLLVAAALVAGDPGRLLVAAIGGAASFLFYGILIFIYPGGMGFGDVKLSGLIGLVLGWFGWAELAVGTLAAFLLGSVVGVAVALIRRSGRKTGIPFGPWMLAGLWIAITVGGTLAGIYLSLFGLR